MVARSDQHCGFFKPLLVLLILASAGVLALAGWLGLAGILQQPAGTVVVVALRIAVAAAVLTALAVAAVTAIGRASGSGDRTLALQAVAERIDQEVHAAIADVKGMTDGTTRDAIQLLEVATNTSDKAANAAAAATQSMAGAETVSSATEQMHAAIGEIAEQAAGSKAVAHKAVALANDVRDMVGTLHAATGTVEAIVSIITEIAARTDLLALNAAVEAARAGGAGKGFAVVAGEVKRLANQTQDATADISKRIAEMRGAVGQVGTAIDDVAEVIREVEVAATSISSAAEQQSAATSEISRAVAEVSIASTGVAELMEGLAIEAEQGRELAEGVRMDTGRMAETVGGLGRALSRVVRTAHPDVDRRAHPRFGTVLAAKISSGGSHLDGFITEFGHLGCAVTLSDRTPLRAGQALEVQCPELMHPRNGTVVAADGLVLHIRFAQDSGLDRDLLEMLAASGSRIIVDKAKSDHRAYVESIRKVIEGNASTKASDLANHHTCRLGKWYDRVTDARLLNHPAYKALMDPHKLVHQTGKDTLNLYHAGDHQGAARAFESLHQASLQVLGILDDLGRDV